MHPSIYISGALHGSRHLAEARSTYDRLAQLLRRDGLSSYVPHKHTDPIEAADLSASSVLERDWKMLSNSAAVIAFLDEPSLGVGAEVAMALERGIPVIGAVRKGHQTSRFLQGLILASDCGELLEYESIEHIARHIVAQKFIATSRNELPASNVPRRTICA